MCQIEQGIAQSQLKGEPYLAVINHDHPTHTHQNKTQHLEAFDSLKRLAQTKFKYRIALIGATVKPNEVHPDSLGKLFVGMSQKVVHQHIPLHHPFLQKDSWILSVNNLRQGIEWCRKNAPAPSKISILFLAANPSNTAWVRLGAESREIQNRLQQAAWRDRFKFEQCMAVTPVDLLQRLLDIRPQIVHFSGHGTPLGALYLENQSGTAQPVQPEALAKLFEQFADHVNCILLNACYTVSQAQAISRHISYVIGMQEAVGDDVATAFSTGFYQALGAGETIEVAYNLGCVQIGLHNHLPKHLTPILLKRA